MPIPSSANFVRFIFGGDCFPGETWDTGLDVVLSSSAGLSITQAQIDACAAQVLGLFQTEVWNAALRPNNDASVNLRRATARLYSEGLLVATGSATVTANAGTGTATHPGYVAAAVTQLTASPSRRGRGRRYLPITAGGVDLATGQYTSTLTSTLAGNYADFLMALNASTFAMFPTSPDPTACVISTTGTTYAVITSVRTDSRPDVIRGRVRSTAPLFISAAPV